MKAPPAERLVAIDVIKGLAIVGVVLYRYVVRGHEAGQDAIATAVAPGAMDGVIAQLHAFARFPIRMQLFMFVGGFLYGRSRMRGGSAATGYWSFIGTRALRLMVPCVVVGMLDWLCRSLLGDLTNPPEVPLHYVPFFSHNRFWFLQALFVLLLIAPALPRSPRWMAVVVPGLYVLAALVRPSTQFLSVDRAMLLAPHFALGYTCVLLGDRLYTWKASPVTQVLAGVAAIASTYVYLKLQSGGFSGAHERLMLTAHSVVATVDIAFIWIMVMRYVGNGRAAPWRALAATGRESMAIYLYHVPAMMPLRLVLSHVSGAGLEAAAGALTVAIGVVVPMALSHFVLSRVPILSAVFLGALPKRGSREGSAGKGETTGPEPDSSCGVPGRGLRCRPPATPRPTPPRPRE